jgi:hypothetical protein
MINAGKKYALNSATNIELVCILQSPAYRKCIHGDVITRIVTPIVDVFNQDTVVAFVFIQEAITALQ